MTRELTLSSDVGSHDGCESVVHLISSIGCILVHVSAARFWNFRFPFSTSLLCSYILVIKYLPVSYLQVLKLIHLRKLKDNSKIYLCRV